MTGWVKTRMGVVLLLGVLLSGCWDGYQMNDLAIINAIAIDYSKGHYMVTAEAYNTSEVPTPGHPTSGSQANKSASVTLTGTGKTLGEAMANVSAESSRHVFWAATTVVILGLGAIKHGMAPITGTLLRYPEFRTTARMFVSMSAAGPILEKTQSGFEITVGKEIRDQDRYLHHDVSEGWAPRTYDVLRWNTQHGRSAVLLAIKPLNDSSSSGSSGSSGVSRPAFSMPDSAVLGPTGMLQGWLPRKDAPAYLWLVHRFDQSFSAVSCPEGGSTTVYWTSVKSAAKLRVGPSGVEGVAITLTGSGKVVGDLCDRLSVISQAANREALNQTLTTVDWAKQHDADIFGWGQMVYRQDPRLWAQLQGSWPDRFRHLPVSVTSHVTVIQGDVGRA